MALPRNEGVLGKTVCCQVGKSTIGAALTKDVKRIKDKPMSLLSINKCDLDLRLNKVVITDFIIIIIVDEHLATIEYFLAFNKW